MENVGVVKLFRFWSEDYGCPLTVKYECDLVPGARKKDTIRIISVHRDDGQSVIEGMSKACMKDIQDMLVAFIYN